MQQAKTLVTIFVCLHLPKDNGPTFFFETGKWPNFIKRVNRFFCIKYICFEDINSILSPYMY